LLATLTPLLRRPPHRCAGALADYAAERGEDVDAVAVHRTKSKLAQGRMAAGVIAHRGVVETIKAAQGVGDKLALVTTTARENVDALLDGLDDVSAEDFDVIIDACSVEEPKPDKSAYTLALQILGVDAASAVAIEDNVIGLASAKAAGVRTIAFPNANTADRDFAAADQRVDCLDPDALICAA
jgi:beta-phosphoglucomutase-like phosphatase (HAD superfamily)